jgi:hypothetical protein
MNLFPSNAIKVIILFLMTANVYAQDVGPVDGSIVTKTISIDKLKKVQCLEDLIDSFPDEDYYVYSCHITRSGKGVVARTTDWKNTYHEKRAPMISDLFKNNEHPPQSGQKYIFDQIYIRRINNKNDSKPYHALELYITD